MYYLIQKTLVECSPPEMKTGESQFVAILTTNEWEEKKELFDMGEDST